MHDGNFNWSLLDPEGLTAFASTLPPPSKKGKFNSIQMQTLGKKKKEIPMNHHLLTKVGIVAEIHHRTKFRQPPSPATAGRAGPRHSPAAA